MGCLLSAFLSHIKFCLQFRHQISFRSASCALELLQTDSIWHGLPCLQIIHPSRSGSQEYTCVREWHLQGSCMQSLSVTTVTTIVDSLLAQSSWSSAKLHLHTIELTWNCDGLFAHYHDIDCRLWSFKRSPGGRILCFSWWKDPCEVDCSWSR